MNLGEISLKIYDRLNYRSSPDSAVVRRIRGYINDTHRTILSKRGLAKLRRKVLPTTCVSGSPFMTLPQAMISIAIITDRVTNLPLSEISIADLRFRDPGLVMSGNPDSYVFLNPSSPVAMDPTAAASLWAISDAVGDGTGVSVSIEGVTSGGYYRKASIAMGGLTAVQIGSAISDWTQLSKFYLSGAATGNVTLRQGSGIGTELARIPPGHTFARYTVVHLSPTPASVKTFYVDGELHLEDMIGPKDEPIIPEDYHDLLISGALVREYGKREKGSLKADEMKIYTSREGDLKAFVRRSQGIGAGERRSNGGQQQFSQLGSMFPAGS